MINDRNAFAGRKFMANRKANDSFFVRLPQSTWHLLSRLWSVPRPKRYSRRRTRTKEKNNNKKKKKKKKMYRHVVGHQAKQSDPCASDRKWRTRAWNVIKAARVLRLVQVDRVTFGWPFRVTLLRPEVVLSENRIEHSTFAYGRDPHAATFVFFPFCQSIFIFDRTIRVRPKPSTSFTQVPFPPSKRTKIHSYMQTYKSIKKNTKKKKKKRKRDTCSPWETNWSEYS